MAIALYPGSFDPVTKGHIDVAERAASLFEELIVAIYDAPPKHLLFSTEERVELMRKALSHIPNVRVDSFSGLTVEFAKKVKADVIVRGLRVSSDFEKEYEMALMNRKLAPEVELVCFMTDLEYEFVSSSLLKEICKLGGSIEDFVPEHVAAALREKFSHEDC
ncbi:MAG: pantetheine-phosphate adenylyltransferase [Dehalococcoidia bacterium]|nr:MAG: pantetheine-phosphate adenylyltransferase [Dehalococcoidia bacterium]